jgi:NAD(P)-dependent dehydrogenase (short-subunit alcohol dehydrogenase family)
LLGLIDTPMVAASLISAYGNDIAEMKRKRDDMAPMGKGDTWDVANVALFLGSEEARYITGVMLFVDGGLSCVFGRLP